MTMIRISTGVDDGADHAKLRFGGGAFPARRPDDWSTFDPNVAVALGRQADSHPAVAAASGTAADFPAVFSLADLDGSNGFRIDGIDRDDNSGASVSSAGDVNGDGIDDLIIGAPRQGSDGTGEAYVVFGRADSFPASFDLADLDGSTGFRLKGVTITDHCGSSVSSAGDVNGDGFDDIIIGAPRAGPGGDPGAGESYVVFGKAGGFDASLDLVTLDGTNGFRIDGVGPSFSFDYSGASVSSAGDLNGDGFDDIVIGASGVDPAGATYVVFGHAAGFDPSIDLASLDGNNGFRIEGVNSKSTIGSAVSLAGDVNGDGFDDIIIGAPGPAYSNRTGESYVVFGKADAFAPQLDLATLDGTNGFRIDGVEANDRCGSSVSSAGDVNGDGVDDVIVGAWRAAADDVGDAGASYVVFGEAGGHGGEIDLASLDGTNGFRIDGVDVGDNSGYAVSGAGDVNGDGVDDVIIGAPGADVPGAKLAGQSYVVFGHAGGFDASLNLASLDGTNGFRLDGAGAKIDSGSSVSAAGDVNADGFDDIIIGAPRGDIGSAYNGGESYVVYGQAPTEAVIRIGSEADQTIRGGEFGDLLRGKQGADVLIGAGGDDWLRGGHDADDLQGGDGADRMQGGSGHDSLMGGAGADVFVLASTSADDSDTLIDFTSGEDRIALGDKAFGLSEGALDPNSFVIGSAAADADDRLIYDDATGKLFFDADGTGGTAQVLIAMLNDAPAITATDFLVG